MRVHEISGGTTASVKIKKGDDPQLLCLKNVAVQTKLKTELVSSTEDDIKLFPKLDVLFVLELQNKIESLLFGRGIKIYNLTDTPVYMPDGSVSDNPLKSITEAMIDLAYGGEIQLGQNDYVVTDLTLLRNHVGTKAISFEGKNSPSPYPYVIKHHTFNADRLVEKVNVMASDFIILDLDAVPEKIEARFNNQKVVYDKEALQIFESDKFGVVGYDNASPVFGGLRTVVLDVRAIDTLEFEDESENKKDIKYYSVTTPFQKI